MSHTAGPWSYRPDQFDDWGVVRAGRYWICQAKDPERLDEALLNECRRNKLDPWEANARLIAAAPELLEALEKSEEHLWRLDGLRPVRDALSVIRLAIAKATQSAASPTTLPVGGSTPAAVIEADRGDRNDR